MSLTYLSRYIILVILLLTGLSLWTLRNIQFDYEVEKFFPEGHPETQFFREYQQLFGNDNDYLLIGIQASEQLLEPGFLLQVDSLTRRLIALPSISTVLSPTNVMRFRRNPLSSSLQSSPYLRIDSPERYGKDSSRIYQEPFLVDFLFSQDRKSISLWVKHMDHPNTADCLTVYEEVNEVLAEFEFEKIHVAGKCFGQSGFISIIQREVVLFTVLSVIVIAIFLWLSYRSLWGIIFPLIIVGITVLWTLSIMTVQGKGIDIIGNLIPTILMVIGISDTIHFITHYLRNLDQGMLKQAALKQTIQEVGLATLLTTFTTGIGFLTLMSSDFRSLADLGLFATIGLVFALILTYTLLPSLLFLMKQSHRSHKSGNFWEQQLDSLLDWVLNHQKLILWCTALLIVLGVFGASRIRLNNYILEDLRQDHPMQQDFLFFADNFAGARPFELYIKLNDSTQSIFEREVLAEISRVDQYLIDKYGVKSLISPVSILKQANQIYHFGSKRQYKLPQDSLELAELSLYVQQFFQEQNLRTVFSEDGQSAKISGKIPDWGSYRVGNKDDAFTEFISQSFDSPKLQYHITGTSNLLDLNTRDLAWNVLQGLVIAVGIVGILMGMLIGSFSMVWISLIPNMLPLMMIAGIMGFTGIDLKISTSIIFVISFGIAVDDSIHFLSRFRRESKQHPFAIALRRTYLSTGKAIVSTSFILSGGFLILCFSDFLGTFYIGLLIAATLFLALVADLILLPVLLTLFAQSSSS